MSERFKSGDPRANYTSEISIANWTTADLGPTRIAGLALWQQREAAGVMHLPDEAQVAGHYIFGHYRREASYRLQRKEAPHASWQLERWITLLSRHVELRFLSPLLAQLWRLAVEDAATSLGNHLPRTDVLRQITK